jgi:hypothetical protein
MANSETISTTLLTLRDVAPPPLCRSMLNVSSVRLGLALASFVLATLRPAHA